MRRVSLGLLAFTILFTGVLTGNMDTGLAQEVFLDSTIEINEAEETITLPLFKGKDKNTDLDVYYIITESSDKDDAEARGVNWSPKLANAIGTAAVQTVNKKGGILEFSGVVDFTPERVVIPGPMGFLPETAVPGSTGDKNYSPLIKIDGNGIVLNAPQLVHGSDMTARHDSVVDINFDHMEVTLELVPGFYHGKEILYISTEASDPGVAALEASTFAPNLNAAPGLASNDPETSARSAIIPFVNGQTGAGNPERQGLNSALLDGLSPMNVTEIHPRNRGSIPLYSPLWDVHPAAWTEDAIAMGEQRRLDHHEDIARAVEEGFIVSGGMGPMNPVLGGLKAAGFIVNCPIMVME